MNHNIAALSVQGSLQRVHSDLSKSLERLSTGLRINRAADDAAGLGVSERLRTQVRGSAQANRNAQDAVALVNVADGAMNEISAILQRSRELAIQAANDTLTDTERAYLDAEYQHLVQEIDRINETATYNGIQVLSGGVDSSVAGQLESSLQTMWLGGGMDRVNAAYGLSVNGPLEVTVEAIDGLAGTGGFGGGAGNPVSGTGSMTLDAADFEAAVVSGDPDGTMPQYGGILNAESLVTHEMTHVMQYMNGLVTSTWFAEGIAEASYGGDERVAAILAANPAWSENDIIAAASFTGVGSVAMDSTWSGSDVDYAAAYLLAMHLDAATGGGGNGVSAILADMKNNGASFATGVSNSLGGAAAVAAWEAAVTGGGLVAGDFGNYGTTGDIAGLGGNIGTRDLSGGALPYGFTALDITAGENLAMHIGANAAVSSNVLEVELAGCSSGALGIDSSGLSSQSAAVASIGLLDSAIDQINSNRSNAGAYINRFEHAINNLFVSETNQQFAETQIRDADFAVETVQFARNQILSQSATSVLSQANLVPQGVLQLLG